MSVLDAIHERRSVRAYSPQRLDQATVRRKLLDAAVWAPTAVHEEPWAFASCRTWRRSRVSRIALKRFSLRRPDAPPPGQASHLLEILDNPDFNIFYNAGTLIIICGRPKGPFVVADCWLAAQNLLLAAHAMGLGSCVIGFAVPALNTPEIKTELGIPAECSAIAPIIVGVPSGEMPPSTRKEPDILAR